jgi:hypothetical protein
LIIKETSPAKSHTLHDEEEIRDFTKNIHKLPRDVKLLICGQAMSYATMTGVELIPGKTEKETAAAVI